MRARRIVNGGNARASGMRHVRGPAAVVAGSRRRERERGVMDWCQSGRRNKKITEVVVFLIIFFWGKLYF